MSIEKRLLVRLSIQVLGAEVSELSQIFYRHLFNEHPELRAIMPPDAIALNKKFFNMMAAFKNVKHLEKIETSIQQLGTRHLLNYGVQPHHFNAMRSALFAALEELLAEKFDEKLRTAWAVVFDEVASIMKTAMSEAERRDDIRHAPAAAGYDQNLLHDVGGTEVVLAVHQRFYDVMFDEPWMERFFFGKEKSVLVRKQTEFMVAAFGGDNQYKGDTPAFVHMHMLITEEQLKVRETILHNALKQQALSEALITRWLDIDRSFWSGIAKQSADECVLKCQGQRAIVIEKPLGYIPPK